ncbi:MAG: phosphoribosylamine--glycine ligase [Acidobacteriota bacterium]
MKKALVVGSGGREHALAWKLASEGWSVWVAPGNAGMEAVATRVPVKAADIRGVVEQSKSIGTDLVVVGPEAPLALGMADELVAHGSLVFGPTAAAARIEGSKVFAKKTMKKFGVPTARSVEFDSAAEALDFLQLPPFGYPVVVKADGLAAGKGVVVAEKRDEAARAVRSIMTDRKFGDAGDRILIEECLRGTEMSFFALAYGHGAIALGTAQDYKRLLDGDHGPNTGGMGSVSPSPLATSATEDRIMDSVVLPVVRGLAAEGYEYRGLLYAGLMITDRGPRVLEFNCRFGDPETQPLMLTIETGLGEAMAACARGEAPNVPARNALTSVCVVLASRGYPEEPEVGKQIHGLEEATKKGAVVFHAATESREGPLVTTGGRVLSVCASGRSAADARSKAYEAAAAISFEGIHYRRDVAAFSA